MDYWIDQFVVWDSVKLKGVSCDIVCFFFQAEDGIRDLVRSRGLGDVYKRQASSMFIRLWYKKWIKITLSSWKLSEEKHVGLIGACLLYTSDAADERSSVDLGGRRIIKKKNSETSRGRDVITNK